jgi:alpha-1,4-digalacturonate transport system permease protein
MATQNATPPAQPASLRQFLTQRRNRRFGLTDGLTYLYLIAGVVVMFGPVVWLVMSSFKDATLINSSDPTFLPYRQVSTQVEGYNNSLLLWDVGFKDYYWNESRVVLPDGRADNGVIHGIDRVMLPERLQDDLQTLPIVTDVPAAPTLDIQPDSILAYLSTTPELTRFADWVTLSNFGVYFNGTVGYPWAGPTDAVFTQWQVVRLADAIMAVGTIGYGPGIAGGQAAAHLFPDAILADVFTAREFTVLAPTNAAIAAWEESFGEARVRALTLPENRTLLNDLIAYHTLPNAYTMARTNRFDTPVANSLLAGEVVNLSLRLRETRRLAQAGPPSGASYPMVDPNNPEEVITVLVLNTSYGDVTIERTKVRELHFSFENYGEGVKAFNFWVYFRNSTIVTIVATIITLLINSMAAFGLSKYKFFGRDVIFVIIISTLMVPISVILVPAFLVISKVGWVNNLWGLIIPGAATPTGVFLLRQYMLTIPDELLDAARIDGASEWRIFWQVILPLARPALAVLAIFSVMWRWNDFLWPLVVVSQNELFTLPVGLKAFQGALNSQEHLILAMTVLTLLPITIIFAFLQQFIAGGIATTGMK